MVCSVNCPYNPLKVSFARNFILESQGGYLKASTVQETPHHVSHKFLLIPLFSKFTTYLKNEGLLESDLPYSPVMLVPL